MQQQNVVDDAIFATFQLLLLLLLKQTQQTASLVSYHFP